MNKADGRSFEEQTHVNDCDLDLWPLHPKLTCTTATTTTSVSTAVLPTCRVLLSLLLHLSCKRTFVVKWRRVAW